MSDTVRFFLASAACASAGARSQNERTAHARHSPMLEGPLVALPVVIVRLAHEPIRAGEVHHRSPPIARVSPIHQRTQSSAGAARLACRRRGGGDALEVCRAHASGACTHLLADLLLVAHAAFRRELEMRADPR